MESRVNFQDKVEAKSSIDFGFSGLINLGNNLYHFGWSTAATVSSYTAAIVAPIFTRVEQFAIGDFRTYLKDPAYYRKQLVSKARESKDGFAIASFGKMIGNVAVWLPNDSTVLAETIDLLDKKPDGRRVHGVFKFYSGTGAFLISDTSPDAEVHRRFLSGMLAPKKFNGETIRREVDQVIQSNDTTTINLKKTMSMIVLNIIAKIILGIDKLPEETYEIMKNFEKDIRGAIGLPFPWLLNLSPAARKQRSSYQSFEQKVLDGQLNAILKDFKEEETPQNKNLILTFLAHLVKQDHPNLKQDELIKYLKNMPKEEIQGYFQTDVMKMLPMLLRPAGSLIDILVIGLSQLALQPKFMERFDEEMRILEESKDDFQKKLMDLPFLDAYFKELLRFDSQITVPRYTRDKIKCGSVDIPGGTTLLIDFEGMHKHSIFGKNTQSFSPYRFYSPAGSEMKSEQEASPLKLHEFPLTPFSVGRRSCPAKTVTPIIFKNVFMYIISKFNLQPAAEQDGEPRLMLEPVSSPRNFSTSAKKI